MNRKQRNLEYIRHKNYLRSGGKHVEFVTISDEVDEGKCGKCGRTERI